MNKNLYFAAGTDVVNAADEALMISADLFVAINPVTSSTTILKFLDRANVGNANTTITLTHDAARNLEVIEAVVTALEGEPKDGFIVVADQPNGVFCSEYITACALTQL
tara:strand:+ start:459 stop:785 length:327 start_codon:yes stop_codon:yes gene_type:complete